MMLSYCIAMMFFCISLFADSHQYQLAAVLMFQNEAQHLREWIEYHKLVDFDHFYLYNNGSTDHFLEVIQPYIDSGEVELFDRPQITDRQADYLKVQCSTYHHALTRARGRAKWLALIDADEFVVPLKGNSILEVLKDYEDVGGLYLNWLCFGTSHCPAIPSNQLMIETLLRCSQEPQTLGKSIVRPERVSACTDPHRMWYHPPFFHVNTNHETFNWVCPVAADKMLLFHYYTGDVEHLTKLKYPRRKKWVELELESYVQSLEHLNAVYNPSMLRFVPSLNKELKENSLSDINSGSVVLA